MPKIIIELEIEGLLSDADSAVDDVLDAGVLQDAINEHDSGVRVTSAICYPTNEVTDG